MAQDSWEPFDEGDDEVGGDMSEQTKKQTKKSGEIPTNEELNLEAFCCRVP